jgi:hypothetical protein
MATRKEPTRASKVTGRCTHRSGPGCWAKSKQARRLVWRVLLASRADPEYDVHPQPGGGAPRDLSPSRVTAALEACPSFAYFWRNHYPES